MRRSEEREFLPPGIDQLWQALDERMGEHAWQRVRALHACDRWSSFDRYAESSQHCAEALRETGLEVEVSAFPADGRTRFGDWIMPLAWDAREATLSLIGHEAAPLASYTEHPQSLVMWSAPTAPKGATGELLVLERGTGEELEGLDVRGRIVLTPRNPAEIKPFVARGGGLGIVSDWLRAKYLPHARQWINTWSDAPGGWAMQACDSRLWGFMLSPEEGARLRAAASAASDPLRLLARVDTRLNEGELHYVMGFLPGETAEEVLLTAHINEQGANDNAAGASTALETACLLSRLLAAGSIAPLRRGIRFLLMPESYGSIAYAARHSQRMSRTRAALNLDTGAGNYDGDDAILDVFPNPLCCPNYVDAALVGLIRGYYAERGGPDRWRLRPYMLAGDNFFGEPRIGVPHPWLWMGDGGDFWHNSADTPDKVDPRSLRDLVSIAAGFAYAMAQLTDSELTAFAHRSRSEMASEQQALLRFPGELELARTPDPDRSSVYDRDRIGALTLDGVSADRWGLIDSSPRWWGPRLAAWWWIDGRRSVGDIAALLEREFGRSPTDPADFLAQLERVGYVRTVNARTG